MVVKSVAINAYQSAMGQQSMAARQKAIKSTVSQSLTKPQEPVNNFNETLKTSLEGVNEMQAEKKQMIEEFATGKRQNVHELMITMQKASMAMQMTTAVRSKVMQSYKEIMQISF